MLSRKQNAFTRPEPIYFCNKSEFLGFSCARRTPTITAGAPHRPAQTGGTGDRQRRSPAPCRAGPRGDARQDGARQPCAALHKRHPRGWRQGRHAGTAPAGPVPQGHRSAVTAGTSVLSWGHHILAGLVPRWQEPLGDLETSSFKGKRRRERPDHPRNRGHRISSPAQVCLGTPRVVRTPSDANGAHSWSFTTSLFPAIHHAHHRNSMPCFSSEFPSHSGGAEPAAELR